MRRIFTGTAVRRAEQTLLDSGAGAHLMRTASWGLANHILNLLRATRKISGARVVGLIGTGNNGGDALWALSFLARRGVSVRAIVLTRESTESQGSARAKIHSEGQDAFCAAGGRFVTAVHRDTDIIVDAVLGTGFTGHYDLPQELAKREISIPPAALVVACDVVSGIDSNTGELASDSAVPADLTVTFGAEKIGHYRGQGRRHSGVVVTVDLGLEPVLREHQSWWLPERDDVTEIFGQPPATDAHKYSRGVVALVAGSPRYPGAAVLVAQAILAAGVGMVNLVVPDSLRHTLGAAVLNACPEVVVTAEPVKQVSAWVVGPGLDSDATASARLSQAVEHAVSHDQPMVVDASALSEGLTEKQLKMLGAGTQHHTGHRRAATVLTPHPGEMRGLAAQFGPVDADAHAFATGHGVAVVLKGPDTLVVTPDGQTALHPQTTSALATAGTGDVLAGILGAGLAGLDHASPAPAGQPERLLHLLAAGVHLHGLAGADAAGHGPFGASQLADSIRRVLAPCENNAHRGDHRGK